MEGRDSLHGCFRLSYNLFYLYAYCRAGDVFLEVLFKDAVKTKLPSMDVLTLFSLLLTTYVAGQIYDMHMTVNMWVIFYILNIVFILIAAVLLEVIKTNFDVLQKLMKAEKLEIVSNLAASISHRVRNPLTDTRGFIQLSYESEIPSETKEQILISIQELDRATGIIDDYLTRSR